MGKYQLFGLLMIWLIFATYLVNTFDTYLGDDTFSVDNPINEIDTTGESDFDNVKGMANTFLSAISFQINGLPFIVSLLFFTIPTMIFAFMSIDILIALLNAVIPF